MKFFPRFDLKRSSASTSSLFNETTFYPAFYKSIRNARYELIIESPFMTVKRVKALLPDLEKLTRSGVTVTVNTRDPREHEDYMRTEAEQSLELLLGINVVILFTGGLHRKVAIIDKSVVWEGSLNILSQNNSCEIMRMTISDRYAHQLLSFIRLKKFLPE